MYTSATNSAVEIPVVYPWVTILAVVVITAAVVLAAAIFLADRKAPVLYAPVFALGAFAMLIGGLSLANAQDNAYNAQLHAWASNNLGTVCNGENPVQANLNFFNPELRGHLIKDGDNVYFNCSTIGVVDW